MSGQSSSADLLGQSDEKRPSQSASHTQGPIQPDGDTPVPFNDMDLLRVLGYDIFKGEQHLSAAVLDAMPAHFHLVDRSKLPVLVVCDQRADPIQRPRCDGSSKFEVVASTTQEAHHFLNQGVIYSGPSEVAFTWIDLRHVYDMMKQLNKGVGVGARRIWAYRHRGDPIIHTHMVYLIEALNQYLRDQRSRTSLDHGVPRWATDNMPGNYGINNRICARFIFDFHRRCAERLREFQRIGLTDEEQKTMLRSVWISGWNIHEVCRSEDEFWASGLFTNRFSSSWVPPWGFAPAPPDSTPVPGLPNDGPPAPRAKYEASQSAPAVSAHDLSPAWPLPCADTPSWGPALPPVYAHRLLDLQQSNCARRVRDLSGYVGDRGGNLALPIFLKHMGINTFIRVPDRADTIDMSHNSGNKTAYTMRGLWRGVATSTAEWATLKRGYCVEPVQQLFKPAHAAHNVEIMNRIANNLYKNNQEMAKKLEDRTVDFYGVINSLRPKYSDHFNSDKLSWRGVHLVNLAADDKRIFEDARLALRKVGEEILPSNLSNKKAKAAEKGFEGPGRFSMLRAIRPDQPKPTGLQLENHNVRQGSQGLDSRLNQLDISSPGLKLGADAQPNARSFPHFVPSIPLGLPPKPNFTQQYHGPHLVSDATEPPAKRRRYENEDKDKDVEGQFSSPASSAKALCADLHQEQSMPVTQDRIESSFPSKDAAPSSLEIKGLQIDAAVGSATWEVSAAEKELAAAEKALAAVQSRLGDARQRLDAALAAQVEWRQTKAGEREIVGHH